MKGNFKIWGNTPYAFNSEGVCVNLRTGNERKPVLNKGNGQMYIQICTDGHYKLYTISRIIADLFVTNPDPVRLEVVEHINCDKTDNRACNLRWITKQALMEKIKRLKKN